MKAELYFEAHVTTEPLEGGLLQGLLAIAPVYEFRVAELIKRNGDKHIDDQFASARDQHYEELYTRTHNFVAHLQQAGIKVRRYKIENTMIDSHLKDTMKLLT